jgi:hypothetical protein
MENLTILPSPRQISEQFELTGWENEAGFGESISGSFTDINCNYQVAINFDEQNPTQYIIDADYTGDNEDLQESNHTFTAKSVEQAVIALNMIKVYLLQFPIED